MRIMDGRLLPGNERKEGRSVQGWRAGGPPSSSSSSVNWRRSKLIQRTRGSYQSDTRRKEGHLGGPDGRTWEKEHDRKGFRISEGTWSK